MKKIAIILTICFCFLGLNSVKADVSTETSPYHRIMKTYEKEFYSGGKSYGYHGTDYTINGQNEIYAQIWVSGLETVRIYGFGHADADTKNFALKGALHEHTWGAK